MSTNGMDRFEEFWNLYPKKRDRGHAEKAWQRLSANTKDIIIKILPEYAFPQNPQFIKYPASWLNGKCWLDQSTTALHKGLGYAEWKPSEKDKEFRKKHGLPEL